MGHWPMADLVLAGSTLYGTTSMAAAVRIRYGVVFKVNTDGSGYTVLKSFTGSDGTCAVCGPGLGGQHALWDD